MKTILVTGGKGLIGGELIKKFSSSELRFKAFDIAFPESSDEYGNILDVARLNQAAEECDGIVHLAAISRVVWGQNQPQLCWDTNVIGTTNVVRAAFKSPKKPWVLYSGSREVYGQQDNLPVKETARFQPMNHYARSKTAAEYVIEVARDSGLGTGIVRYSNVYGTTTDHFDRVIPAFCRAAATGENLNVEGSKNTFDFAHLDDTVDGTMIFIEKLLSGVKDLPSIHLTTGVPTTLAQAAALAVKAGNNRSKVNEATPRNFDVAGFYGDPSRAKDLLNWQANITIEDGIKDLVKKFEMECNKEAAIA